MKSKGRFRPKEAVVRIHYNVSYCIHTSGIASEEKKCFSSLLLIHVSLLIDSTVCLFFPVSLFIHKTEVLSHTYIILFCALEMGGQMQNKCFGSFWMLPLTFIFWLQKRFFFNEYLLGNCHDGLNSLKSCLLVTVFSGWKWHTSTIYCYFKNLVKFFVEIWMCVNTHLGVFWLHMLLRCLLFFWRLKNWNGVCSGSIWLCQRSRKTSESRTLLEIGDSDSECVSHSFCWPSFPSFYCLQNISACKVACIWKCIIHLTVLANYRSFLSEQLSMWKCFHMLGSL